MTERKDIMKYLLPITVASICLAACSQASDPDASTDSATDTQPMEAEAFPAELNAEGKVLITVDRLIYEDAACLVMMDVINGTDETVTAGLFTFDVTGNGETAGANMFPQRTEPQSIVTAQIVLPGADCDNATLIEGGQLNCKIADTDESCMDVIELRDGAIDFAAND